MDTINAVGTADGDADGMNRDRVVASEIRAQLESVRIGEKILRMNLEPSDGRASGHHLRNVRKPKADTGPFSRALSSVTGDGHVSLSWLLRLKAATDDAVAVSRRHVDPGFRIAIELRGSPTRVVAGRCAVVLAGLRDAVALLGLERGRRRDG